MAREGIPFILVFLIPAAIFFFLAWWVAAAACAALALFMAFFFRDPNRDCPDQADKLIVSPADGRVVIAAKIDPNRNDSPTQVSIFLSPLDVHINRSPIAGQIVEVVYKPGAFHVASKDIASVENEQNIITIRGAGVELDVRQIAGVLARRVVLWKKKGDSVSLGERIGLMKFSSRMDVLIPDGFDVLVKKGDRVVGGVTPLARRR